MVGKKTKEDKETTHLGWFFFECQYAKIIKGIWKGILIKASVFVIPNRFWGVSETYRYMFAGKTITSKNISNKAPILLVLELRIAAPPMISIRPVT